MPAQSLLIGRLLSCIVTSHIKGMVVVVVVAAAVVVVVAGVVVAYSSRRRTGSGSGICGRSRTRRSSRGGGSSSSTVDGQNLAPAAHAYFKRVRHQTPHPLLNIGSWDYLSGARFRPLEQIWPLAFQSQC